MWSHWEEGRRSSSPPKFVCIQGPKVRSDFKKRLRVMFMSKLNGDLIQALGVLQIAIGEPWAIVEGRLASCAIGWQRPS